MIIAGYVEDMPALLAASDLFVLSSRLERHGLVTLEAMASSVPVIVTRAGGSEETVVDRQSGILVPPDSPQALADALVLLANDPAMRATIGARARERVEEHYEVEHFVTQFMEFAQSSVEQRGRSVRGAGSRP